MRSREEKEKNTWRREIFLVWRRRQRSQSRKNIGKRKKIVGEEYNGGGKGGKYLEKGNIFAWRTEKQRRKKKKRSGKRKYFLAEKKTEKEKEGKNLARKIFFKWKRKKTKKNNI